MKSQFLTPYHNRVVEQKNQTIMDMTRSMLKAKGLPNKECLKYYPWKVWNGFKPNMKHLKVFGSIVYAYVPAEIRTKLDDWRDKTIFISYSHGKYKLFNPMTTKVMMSRDVTFAEDEAWNWNATIHNESEKNTYYNSW